MLNDWATLILNCPERHNIYNVPQTQEFVIALKPKRGASVQQPSQQQPNFIILPQSDAYSGSYSRSHSRSRSRSPLSSSSRSIRSRHSREYDLHTPTKQREMAPFSSPLVSHSSWEKYNGDGLMAFISFCELKYQRGSDDTEFKEAYRILSNEKIGIDTLKNKDESWYVTQHKIKAGTAERLVRCYPKYCASLLA